MPLLLMFHRTFLFVLLSILPAAANAQLDFEKEPISYSERTPEDPVYRLSQRLEQGSAKLPWESGHGRLRALLRALDIPESSQTLVFSKTSLQISRISPRTPRAIYFNDDIYVGWVQRGDVIEISAADPQLGGTFYTLSQSESGSDSIRRETGRCLQCHGSTHTRRIPGHIVRSVYPDRSGQPVFRMGTHITEPRSPLSERFGGWYVTGTGVGTHMGNAWVAAPDENETLDRSQASDVTDLSEFLSTRPYLTQHSDVLALLVLQHQVHVHNMLTAANHAGLLTERDAQIMNKALEREPDYRSESTQRRYRSAAEKVVRAVLMCDTLTWNQRVTGTSNFRSEFEARGPKDPQGRSLRQLDTNSRLFRYPCSFLVYSEPFAQLHPEVHALVLQRIDEILTSGDEESYDHLSAEDRQEVKAILRATGVLPGEPELTRPQ
ncbi:MAG: hypothetical protein NXI04_28730 [Planctomycetaceae bacterium]|nr:hypothetical protein [Planctomycetaceae bacterium]